MHDDLSCLAGARTLLLVDDNPHDRQLYRLYLAQHTDCSFTFFEAAEADRALQMCGSLHIDCMLLDQELPGCSGLELLDRLRRADGSVGVPVVMVTGRGSEYVAAEAIRKGALDYVVKAEVAPSTLLRAVVNAIERSAAARLLAQQVVDREASEEALRQALQQALASRDQLLRDTGRALAAPLRALRTQLDALQHCGGSAATGKGRGAWTQVLGQADSQLETLVHLVAALQAPPPPGSAVPAAQAPEGLGLAHLLERCLPPSEPR